MASELLTERSAITVAFETILANTDGEDDQREGLLETPDRAARAWAELTSGYGVDIASLFKTFDGERYDELIVERAIPFTSLCEHHLLAFQGHVSVGYIPNGRIVGLSKIARLVEAYARRLQVQERLTVQIADAVHTHLRAQGVIVVVEAEHSCMAVRGVRKPGVSAVTSAIRGNMRDDVAARQEALALMRGGA